MLSDANTLFIFRENSTLHHQVEQMLQKISPLQKCQEELGSLKAELEEKKVPEPLSYGGHCRLLGIAVHSLVGIWECVHIGKGCKSSWEPF